MEKISRLFDLLEQYVDLFPKKNMLHAKIKGKWEGIPSTEVKNNAIKLAIALKNLGIAANDYTPEGQDKVAIIANNRPEWTITDFATQYLGGVVVPIYPSITEAEWEYILNEAAVKVLFISDKHIYKKVARIQQNVPTLKHIYSFDEIEGVQHWSHLLQEVSDQEIEEINQIKKTVKGESLVTIIYTSGTTGNPKGVMLSHNNIVSNVRECMSAFQFCSSENNILSFLPLNHIFERTVMNIYINKGVSIYFAEGMETIGNDLKEVKPVVFTTVPRLLEKVYEKIDAKGSQLTGLKRKIFDWAVGLALQFEINKPQSTGYKLQMMLADKLVFSKWREAIGGNIKAIVTGSAACQVKLLRLFTAAKIIVMEGYGLTETSPVISVNRFEQNDRMFGTVGTVIDEIEVKLLDDGEIVCKGPNVMMGYYKHPELTDEVIIDGWFHTGDIGTMVDDKFLKITDRKKEIFKISGGKYVAPLPIENKMKESVFIEQIMVVGSNEKFAGALIVPAMEKIIAHFSKMGMPIDKTIDKSQNKDILKLIRAELDIYNKLFAAHEQVKKFQLVTNEWTIDGGEMTATMKLKRKVIMNKYADLIARIYN
jgi:long-chain acyl-CoA synthetase